MLPKEKADYRVIVNKCIADTKKALKESVSKDNLIISAINNVGDIDRAVNILVKRLREWYGFYFPEFEHDTEDHERFVKTILEKSREDLVKEKDYGELMGADLSQVDLEPILTLAKQIDALFDLREKQKDYIEKVMQDYCPNLTQVAGALIGARLIEHTGSLEKLASLPSNIVQILGAEKALFRHLKTHARPPKWGVIHEHYLIGRAPKEKKAKAARGLASAISICARIDFFKGEDFKGYELKEELEKKFL